ncbi:RNA-directed DNA polymerase, eukaryota, reverse transcriptase zinc-binding domain protein [Tanacetum coccineum]
MGSSVCGGYKLSNESLLERLSCNSFITNFPVHLSAKKLWNTCAQYGTVQYIYIPKKLSKQGSPFAFPRFNKVNDVDTLIKNLRSIWLGNFCIYANVVGFTRESKPKSFSQNSAPKEPMHVNSKPKESFGYTPSFAKVVKGNEVQECHDTSVMVLEPGSLNYGGYPVLKDFKTLPNIHNVCFSEKFNRVKISYLGVKISYLGSYWALLEFESPQSCEKFQKHNGINSWFSSLKQWNAQFEIPDRVVWIDVEGTPLQAWSHANFNRIVSKWGELIYMDESNASSKYSMRLCVKTRVHHLLSKSFKVILEGKVLVVSAKEVTRWVPDFEEDDIAQSEDGSDNNSVGIHKWEEENNDDEVIPNYFQSILNEYNIMENSPGQMESSPNHVENFDVHVENSHEQLEDSHDHVENSTEQIENSHNHVENSYVHVENSPVHLENSHDLCGDPFSLEKLILE